MTPTVPAVPVGEASLRWQQWQARGVRRDVRLTTRMRAVLLAVGIGFCIVLLLQFV